MEGKTELTSSKIGVYQVVSSRLANFLYDPPKYNIIYFLVMRILLLPPSNKHLQYCSTYLPSQPPSK